MPRRLSFVRFTASIFAAVAFLHALSVVVEAQAPLSPLEAELRAAPAGQLAEQALATGNPQRGAMLFFQQRLACAKCHSTDESPSPLGPNLAEKPKGDPLTPSLIVEALLHPSKRLRPGFQPVVMRLDDGRQVRGLIKAETDKYVELRDIAREGAVVRIEIDSIEARKADTASLMPEGLAGQLGGRQQFLDLVKYLHEVATGGPSRAKELQPPLALMGIRPLPEYERRIDHKGILTSLDGAAAKRGRETYNRLCINCHGTHDRPGSLPTSLRFASGKFKRGSDPYSMYLTLTHGYGQMVAQTWMAPTQKYDVIHYIREAYLKTHNSSQYFELSDSYLASLPIGDTRGPAPRKFEPWATMNYGHTLTHTYEIGKDAHNFAYKGIAVRLDPGPGGVSQGRRWMVFDEDTLRWAAGWSGSGFIDWNGIMFNGRHNIHPRIAGRVHFENPTGPGWGNPQSTDKVDLEDPRFLGRDERPYGPLPRKWAQFKGLYHYGQQAIVSYEVDGATVMEMPAAELLSSPKEQGEEPSQANPAAPILFQRNMNIGPRSNDLFVTVARAPETTRKAMQVTQLKGSRSVVQFGGAMSAKGGPATRTDESNRSASPVSTPKQFDGSWHVELPSPRTFQLAESDFTIHARIKTRSGGVIFSKTSSGPQWKPDCKALFVRGGRLNFDIGWVGVIRGKSRVNDNRWHDVAMTWRKDGSVAMFVDGKLDGEGKLSPEGLDTSGHVVRIGFGSPNFPSPSAFRGEIALASFHPAALNADQVAKLRGDRPMVLSPGRIWRLQGVKQIADQNGKHVGKVVPNPEGKADAAPAPTRSGDVLMASVHGLKDAAWSLSEQGDLVLRIPAGDEPLRLNLAVAAAPPKAAAELLTRLADALGSTKPAIELKPLTQGGPAPWGVPLPSLAFLGDNDGPFATDVLMHPAANPWLARVRLTGFDFFDDDDRAAVCSWDGDVWHVSGLNHPDGELQWRRIASGMFQPLGVKIVGGDIYISCRDQITILRDLNDDGETDFYECFNNDHQVTEHFHEFAMGLQRDKAGNFYYAKSARHALKALVPHHGTLLRVTPDGKRTDILATGFRAANGVCLNPDGTFIVTDQEGHWNPKNRINWVKKGGFYGNMYGYHDVTDSSDEAMQQPLCWITNSFDRSPAELLWVDSKKWGPLNGSLLNLSYGYGRVFVVPHETVNGQVQGGMCKLPIPDTPTGLIRGRFHPTDGQLYACGMFAWAGSKTQPGGFYRIRHTGKPVHLPVKIEATKRGVRLTYSGDLDKPFAETAGNYHVKTWSLKRTKNYGSRHYDEKELDITAVRVSDNGQVVELDIKGIQPTWCMEIKYRLRGAGGEPIEGVIHNTIHSLGP